MAKIRQSPHKISRFEAENVLFAPRMPLQTVFANPLQIVEFYARSLVFPLCAWHLWAFCPEIVP
ncbi:MAG: hypothetical protein PVJ86_09005, partial [Phycisphaerales bacterium]